VTARPIPTLRALFRLIAVMVAAALLLPLGIGCAAQAAPAVATHMDCEGKSAPAKPAHDCASDCALACAAIPVPPLASGSDAVGAAIHAQPAMLTLASLARGPAPPPPRG
jgi:hypothetical protein